LYIEDIVKYCCSEQEQLTLHTLSGYRKYCYFYKLWVIKEALVKATGFGLSYDLRQIHISSDKNKLNYSMNFVKHNKVDYTISMFKSYNEYYSAFAVKKPIDRVFFLTY
jgi:phosphopantetheinyl transferase